MIVAVDTGGTKTLIAAFTKSGKMVHSLRFLTPASPSEYVRILRESLQEHYGGKEVEAIAIGLPGIVENGVALWCNNLGWKNFKALEAFEGVLGDVPVFIENDANLAGLSETRALKEIPTSSFYVTISTGIGTGVTTNGTIDPGLRKSEGGRMLVEFDGMVREWETFASGKAIYTTYKKFARDIKSQRQWYQISHRISRGFLAAIPLIQPDIIIIGGSMGAHFDKFKKPLRQILEEKLPPHIPCPPIIQAKYPEEAVVYGCYYYAVDLLTTQKA